MEFLHAAHFQAPAYVSGWLQPGWQAHHGPAQPGPAGAGRTAARPEPYAELDLALDAAAAAPQPTAATFAELGLDQRLVRALAAQGISEPFAIQARALPDALAGRDVLGRAQTGSGKTLAFGLPLLNLLAAGPASRHQRLAKAPRGLVLVPTRELAQQVADVLAPLGRSVGVSVTTVYGGVAISPQIPGRATRTSWWPPRAG